MSRIHRGQRTVHVRCTQTCTEGGEPQGPPAQFIWRDRLYRVHRVLQQWDRSPAWWQDVLTAMAAGPAGRDVRTWRVEASAGRCDTSGVYDLSYDPADGHWRLIRTFD